MQHKKIRVTSIQRLCVDDGPGVRTVIFLKGCYLNCPWCCNPETRHYNKNLYFKLNSCINSNIICKSCEIHKGNRNRFECPYGTYEKTFQDYTCDQLFEIISKDKKKFDIGGGITLSGGEPLYQAKELLPLLELLKTKNISIAIETTLFGPEINFELLKPYIDYWLVDLKFQYGYIKNNEFNITEKSFQYNLKNLQSTTKNIEYRMVVMTEIINNAKNISKLLHDNNIKELVLLPYHNLAKKKYDKLGLSFCEYGIPNGTELCFFADSINKNNIKVKFINL